MAAASVPLVAGLMMGLASGLHCAGMCGSIASALTLSMSGPAGSPNRMRCLLLPQAGRVFAYATAGAVLGAFGSGIAGAFDQTAAYRALQWASAVALVWIGLSTAGLVPFPLVFDRLAAPIGTALMGLSSRHPALGLGTPLAAGILWGFMPCAMVYGALFSAMLTGTGAGGATLMLGFGLGTVPAVVLTALGLVCLRDLARRRALARAIGLSLAAFGAASVFISPAGGVFCLPLG